MPAILHRDLVLTDVPRETVDYDIVIYFWQELNDVELSAPGVECLVEKACGLFIWAATACRYIKAGRRVTKEELDQIYTRILLDSIRGDYAEEEKTKLFSLFRRIVGAIVVLFDPLSAKALCELLNSSRQEDIRQEDIKQTLNDLHSVLEIPESQPNPIRLLHPSFRDFLLAKERCQTQQL
ncbi:hypothetical protein AOQ84DRAFT_374537 [Glonium stellatum]|uniref:Uncharacterized protein n=1 Tax=Glonium stellatum TaxID=574774 RepID=A0A8E2F666_9PEZI|nr:hypothetical protein AOQ84DRAFT_374537 [Glonium stellatum]